MNVLISIVAFIIVFGLLVFIHEFGHFFTAKLNGITVHEFSLGMGPRLFKYKGEETEYSLRALPIGGYVKMEGEDEASNQPGSFSSKKPLQRLSVIAAGPIMNFFLAIVLFAVIFMSIGVPVNSIGELIEDKPAVMAGIEVGDKILAVDGERVSSWEQVVDKISNAKEETVNILVNRNGSEIEFNIEAETDSASGRRMIGIAPKLEANIILSLKYSFERVVYVIKAILQFLARFVMGQASSDGVVGPIGMARIVGTAANSGIIDLMGIAALISVNLGIINLLPLPALDGGRIIFILIELLRGKPVPSDKEGFVHFIGFVLLMTLMLMVVFREIKMLF